MALNGTAQAVPSLREDLKVPKATTHDSPLAVNRPDVIIPAVEPVPAASRYAPPPLSGLGTGRTQVRVELALTSPESFTRLCWSQAQIKREWRVEVVGCCCHRDSGYGLKPVTDGSVVHRQLLCEQCSNTPRW